MLFDYCSGHGICYWKENSLLRERLRFFCQDFHVAVEMKATCFEVITQICVIRVF